MADRIGVIHEGRLAQLGTPREIYERPRNLYVAARLGSPAINVLPRDLLPLPAAPHGIETVGARTEHVRIARSINGDAVGTVEWIEHLGDQNHLHVSIGEHKLVTLVDPTSPLTVGDRVTVTLRRPLYFDRNGERVSPQ